MSGDQTSTSSSGSTTSTTKEIDELLEPTTNDTPSATPIELPDIPEIELEEPTTSTTPTKKTT